MFDNQIIIQIIQKEPKKREEEDEWWLDKNDILLFNGKVDNFNQRGINNEFFFYSK